MHRMDNAKLVSRLLIIVAIWLSGCQVKEEYVNSELGFTFTHPSYWELIGTKINEVEFHSKKEGDAIISITIKNESGMDSASGLLSVQLERLLIDTSQDSSKVSISEIEHQQYDIAMAHITYLDLFPFNYDYYLAVIQGGERTATIRTAGDGVEPFDAIQTIIKSFEFLP